MIRLSEKEKKELEKEEALEEALKEAAEGLDPEDSPEEAAAGEKEEAGESGEPEASGESEKSGDSEKEELFWTWDTLMTRMAKQGGFEVKKSSTKFFDYMIDGKAKLEIVYFDKERNKEPQKKPPIKK